MHRLIVRREQMQVLEQCALERFLALMSSRLREAYPRETAGLAQPEFLALIRGAIWKAETHGVTDEADVERYLEFVVRYGQHFEIEERSSWAGAILRRDDLSGTEKMNALDDYELFGTDRT